MTTLVSPVTLLATERGKTFPESGLVVLRESRAAIERSRTSGQERSRRDIAIARTYEHEAIHFLQVLTCAYVYFESIRYVDACVAISEKLDFPREWPTDELESFHERTWERAHAPGKRVEVLETKDGLLILPVGAEKTISVADILEGVADLAAFQRTTRGGSVAHYLDDLSARYSEDDGAPYWNAFSYVAHELGAERAYNCFSPLSFLALNTRNPARTLVEVVAKGKALGARLDSVCRDLDALFELIEAKPEGHHVFHLTELSNEHRHLTLTPCLEHTLRVMSPRMLLGYAADPSRMNDAPVEHITAVFPPVVVMSSDESGQVTTSLRGAARENQNLGSAILEVTALCGAAERLVAPNEPRYQFCPHRTCSHYESALCFRHFTPPFVEHGADRCRFPSSFSSFAQVPPADAWAKLGYARITVPELVAEFEAAGEAGILELARKRKATIVGWLGREGFNELEWKCQVVADKVLRAMQTRKIDHLIEARYFRDAVVQEVVERSKRSAVSG
jgi:hypothetical protein